MLCTLMLIIFVICGFLLIYLIRSQEKECIINPIQYGVERLAKANELEISCTCFSTDKPTQAILFNASRSIP